MSTARMMAGDSIRGHGCSHVAAVGDTLGVEVGRGP